MSRTTTRPMFDHLARATLAALIPATALAALAATPQGAAPQATQAAQPDIALITQATRGLALRGIGRR